MPGSVCFFSLSHARTPSRKLISRTDSDKQTERRSLATSWLPISLALAFCRRLFKFAHERVYQIMAEICTYPFWIDELRCFIPRSGRFRMWSRDAHLSFPIICNQRSNLAVGICCKHDHVGCVAAVKEEKRAILKVHGAQFSPPMDVHDSIGLSSHTRSSRCNKLVCVARQEPLHWVLAGKLSPFMTSERASRLAPEPTSVS